MNKKLLKLNLFKLSVSSIDFRTITDYNHLLRLATLCSLLFNFFHHIHAFNNSSKYNMLSIQPWCLSGGNKELAPVGIRPRISHWQAPDFMF